MFEIQHIQCHSNWAHCVKIALIDLMIPMKLKYYFIWIKCSAINIQMHNNCCHCHYVFLIDLNHLKLSITVHVQCKLYSDGWWYRGMKRKKRKVGPNSTGNNTRSLCQRRQVDKDMPFWCQVTKPKQRTWLRWRWTTAQRDPDIRPNGCSAHALWYCRLRRH